MVHQFIVGFGFPPVEAGHEIDHARVTLQHGHSGVAAAVHPPAPGVRPYICAAAGGLSGRLIAASHDNLPSHAAQRVG